MTPVKWWKSCFGTRSTGYLSRKWPLAENSISAHRYNCV